MAGQGLNSNKVSEKRKREIRSAGGSASGANFKNDPGRASREGKKGGMAGNNSSTNT
jgi:general stress protein YciG